LKKQTKYEQPTLIEVENWFIGFGSPNAGTIKVPGSLFGFKKGIEVLKKFMVGKIKTFFCSPMRFADRFHKHWKNSEKQKRMEKKC